jgi:hypothetical protein
VPDLSTPTPLVVDIARRLKSDGWFVMHVEPEGWRSGQLQAVVDISWAARQAGRLIDRRVEVTTTRVAETSGTFTVTAVLQER